MLLFHIRYRDFEARLCEISLREPAESISILRGNHGSCDSTPRLPTVRFGKLVPAAECTDPRNGVPRPVAWRVAQDVGAPRGS